MMNLCVVFDIDGVLINVEKSFHEAIKQTVPLYIQHVLKKSVDNLCVNDETILKFKSLGGFNDDWDVTAGIIYYYVSLCDDSSQHVDNWNIASFINRCQGQGLAAVLTATEGKNASWVQFDKSLLPKQQLHPRNLVKRIFQEVYWGQTQFKDIYKEEPLYVFCEGVVQNEKPLMSHELLQKIQDQSQGMAIATGRERADALFSLEKFSYLPVFDTIVTLTDVGEDFKKPHPRSLENIHQFFLEKGFKDCQYIYIGDQIDDMAMAFQAQEQIDVWPIGFIYDHDLHRSNQMKLLGVQDVVASHQEVVDIIKQRKIACG